MKQIKIDGDFTVMMNDYKANINRIIEQAQKAGLKLNLEIWPTEDEFRSAFEHPKHRLFEKYYGTDDYVKIYNVVEGVIEDPVMKENCAEFLNNWKGSRSRQQSTNTMQETINWGINYDPVSRLVILASIAADADNACFSFSNEDKNWLKHNVGYFKKIGMSSQYHPELLKKAESDYGRTEQITLTDEDVEYLVNAAKLLQESIGNMKCVPYEIEDVMNRALDRNNKSAESAPGFRNLKHKKVRDDVLDDAKFIRDHCDYSDIQLMNEQKRIQSGGNILFDKYYPINLDNDGKIIFNIDEVFTAINVIASERGYFDSFYEELPVVLPGLIPLIKIEELPQSLSNRTKLVELNGYPEFILKKDKISGEWVYNYKLSAPQVFNIVSDKYEDESDLSSEIFTKHRSIKAAMGAYSKVGQSYLYSFLDQYKERVMNFNNPFYSLVAQWSHPDDLKAMITSSAKAAFPQLYEGEDISASYSEEKLLEFRNYVDKFNYKVKMSSDDKTGFDMVQKIYTTFLFYCAYFSIPFEMTEDNIRLFKMFIINDCISIVSCVDDIIMYFEIIGSGQWNTSIKGTYASNTASLVMRQKFGNPYTKSVITEADQEDNTIHDDSTGGDLNEY